MVDMHANVDPTMKNCLALIFLMTKLEEFSQVMWKHASRPNQLLQHNQPPPQQYDDVTICISNRMLYNNRVAIFVKRLEAEKSQQLKRAFHRDHLLHSGTGKDKQEGANFFAAIDLDNTMEQELLKANLMDADRAAAIIQKAERSTESN